MKLSFSVVGCGKVGTLLAKYLVSVGYPVHGLASRTLASAEKAATLCGATRVTDDPMTVTRDAGMVFITTPDGVIEDVCTAIAEKGGFTEKTLVFHCSGSLPSTVLSAARRTGAVIGSIHPLQSFATTTGDKNPFEGIVMAVEGEDEAVNAGLDMAEILGARGFKINTSAKTLYHASAVVASNCLVALVDFAYQLLEASGIGYDDAYTVLGPLIEGTLSNIKTVGPTQALTGPVVRGDASTVADHLAAIDKDLPHINALYTALGRQTLEVAKRRGTLSGAAVDALEELLK